MKTLQNVDKAEYQVLPRVQGKFKVSTSVAKDSYGKNLPAGQPKILVMKILLKYFLLVVLKILCCREF